MFDDVMPGKERICIRVPADTVRLRNLLREEGYTILLCGGFVRDCVLGRKPSDMDFFCDGYGLINVLEKNSIEWHQHSARNVLLVRMGKLLREVSLPNLSFSLEEDARGRDMNYNVLYSTLEGEILDPLGMYSEINAREPVKLLSEDALVRDDNRSLRFLLLHYRIHPDVPPDTLSLNWAGLHPPLWNHPRYIATLLKILGLPRPVPVILTAQANAMMSVFTTSDIARFIKAWTHGERRPRKLLKVLSAELPRLTRTLIGL